jgi:methyltransferase (TIGR00027 family)
VSSPEPLVRNISDTALLAAIYRARETDRSDAAFRDPFARRLAGERGDQIAKSMPMSEKATWAWIARTYAYDQIITQQISRGTDMVVNLAAGLDTRPYRMALPASLRWIEVDLPGILDYKESVLRAEKPTCVLERVRLDLANLPARRELFARLGREAKNVLVMSEGLLIYFTADDVAALARDLGSQASFQCWALEITSPGLLQMLKKGMGQQISQGNAEFRFAPAEGPGFFEPYGWTPVEVRSMIKTGAHLKRLSFWMRLMSMLPESNGRQGSRPWSAVCLMRNQSAAKSSN